MNELFHFFSQNIRKSVFQSLHKMYAHFLIIGTGHMCAAYMWFVALHIATFHLRSHLTADKAHDSQFSALRSFMSDKLAYVNAGYFWHQERQYWITTIIHRLDCHTFEGKVYSRAVWFPLETSSREKAHSATYLSKVLLFAT